MPTLNWSAHFTPLIIFNYIHVLTTATEYQGVFHTAFFQASAYMFFPKLPCVKRS